MVTVTCPTCQKEFTKESAIQAESALRMHTGRKHTGAIPNATLEQHRRLKLSTPTEPAIMTEEERKAQREEDKRQYQARYRARKRQEKGRSVIPNGEVPPDSVQLHYCPHCGANLRVFARAASVASRMGR